MVTWTIARVYGIEKTTSWLELLVTSTTKCLITCCVWWIVTASFDNCILISCWLYYCLHYYSVSIYRSVYSTNNASSTHSQSSTTDYNNIISLTDDDSDNRLSIGQLFSVHMSHDYKELSVYHYVIYHTAEEYQTRDLSLVVLWKPF